ncbi:hypothetical protein B296_00055607, partial [Ensete ventricosum]
RKKMDPDSFRSRFSSLAFGNVMAAAARDYQKDPELEKLHADRIAALKDLLNEPCRIMDKHLKALAPMHLNTKFVKLDAENAPFFVTKLAIKTLPCVVLFRFYLKINPFDGNSSRNGIACERLVGFQDLGSKDDFTTRALENLLKRKGNYSLVDIFAPCVLP